MDKELTEFWESLQDDQFDRTLDDLEERLLAESKVYGMKGLFEKYTAFGDANEDLVDEKTYHTLEEMLRRKHDLSQRRIERNRKRVFRKKITFLKSDLEKTFDVEERLSFENIEDYWTRQPFDEEYPLDRAEVALYKVLLNHQWEQPWIETLLEQEQPLHQKDLPLSLTFRQWLDLYTFEPRPLNRLVALQIKLKDRSQGVLRVERILAQEDQPSPKRETL